MPYSEIEKRGAMLPLLELKCRFLSFARYEDEIIVETRIKEFTGTRLLFGYTVYKKGSDKPITEGETLHVWTNRELKPVNIKKYAPEIYALLEKANRDADL